MPDSPPGLPDAGSAGRNPAPLTHVRVLDLSRLLPGPMATLHMADLGADVIRIEPVVEEESVSNIRQVLHRLLNRNKRAIRLDLTQLAGREIFLRLAKDADVIMEGFRPGVADRLGIGYEAIRQLNPRIVYCSISGYGQTGPERLRAGHDINYLASAGVADQIGVSGEAPAIPNLQVGDLMGGSLTSVMGILAALIDAQARGRGHYIDVSMTDSLLAHSVLPLATMTASCQLAPRGEDMLSGGLACYNYYRAQDGRYLAVGALEAKFWERLCDALGRPDLKSKHLVRGEEARRTRHELQTIFGSRGWDHWVCLFRDVDCCVTPVLTLEEAMASAQSQAREMVMESRFASPLRMDGVRIAADPQPPVAGAQSCEILEAAGYRTAEIEAFLDARVIA